MVLLSQLRVILMFIGIDPFLSGFVYDVFFAGIPCRDPTQEMEARYDRLRDPLDRGGPVSRRAGDWHRLDTLLPAPAAGLDVPGPCDVRSINWR